MLVKAMWAVTTETSETCDLKLHKLTATEHQQKPVSQLNLEICGVINYGSDWRKDVINQCLEFGPCNIPFLPVPFVHIICYRYLCAHYLLSLPLCT